VAGGQVKMFGAGDEPDRTGQYEERLVVLAMDVLRRPGAARGE
jgi:hypothetical protein